jgi:hypothetical protein
MSYIISYHIILLKRNTSDFIVEILSLFYLERAEKGGFVFVSGPVLDANRKK